MYVRDWIVLLDSLHDQIVLLAGSRELLSNPDVKQWLWKFGNLYLYHCSQILMSCGDSDCWVTLTWRFLFLNHVENAPNPLIGLGNDPGGFYDEEMVGRIFMNKDDLDVWFNSWIDWRRMKYWFDCIVYLFEDPLSTCRWVTSLHNWLVVGLFLCVALCVAIFPFWIAFLILPFLKHVLWPVLFEEFCLRRISY